ncbi:MAG: hypothetical protein VXY29_02730 [Cyanobacteriota bacterium]|nr:hypothetical protein [Cyanobacteriota bacterium]
MRFLPVLLTPALWLPAQAMPQEAAVDLALGYCLHSEGRASQMQSYRFVQALGAKQGWPSGWYQQIRPNQIQAAINSAGGCGRLLQRAWGGQPLQRRPRVVQRQPRVVQRAPRSGSRSAAEGFGLAPYR